MLNRYKQSDLHKLNFIPKLRAFSMKWNKPTLTKEEQKKFKRQLPKLKKIKLDKDKEPLPMDFESFQICLEFQC